MNKTQKGAWFSLAGTILAFTIGFYLIFRLAIQKKPPERFCAYLFPLTFLLYIVAGIFFLLRKQSPNEPDYDERDNRIKQKAWIAAFISVGPLFLAVSVIPQFFVGLDGTIPVWLLPIVTVSLFYPVMLVYSIAVLVQYGWGAKGEKS
ncbi:MAG: hypothetical protein ACYS3S_07825 [Planctomycetota bacterium]|jgi:hypothetical protein